MLEKNVGAVEQSEVYMKLGTYSISDLQVISNQVKDQIIDALVREKFLSQEQADIISGQYCVIFSEKGWLGKLWDKILQTEDDKMYVNIVKRV